MDRPVKLAILACISLTTAACAKKGAQEMAKGRDVTASFLGGYSGKFIDDETRESIVIGADGSLVFHQVTRSPRSAHPPASSPSCTTIRTGKITKVTERSAEERVEFASHSVEITFESTKLDMSAGARQSDLSECLKLEKTTAETQELPAELLNADTIRVHSHGLDSATPRPDAAFDEIFTREGAPVTRYAFSETLAKRYEHARLECIHEVGRRRSDRGSSSASRSEISWDLLSDFRRDKEIEITGSTDGTVLTTKLKLERWGFVSDLKATHPYSRMEHLLVNAPMVSMSWTTTGAKRAGPALIPDWQEMSPAQPFYENIPKILISGERGPVNGPKHDVKLVCRLKTALKTGVAR